MFMLLVQATGSDNAVDLPIGEAFSSLVFVNASSLEEAKSRVTSEILGRGAFDLQILKADTISESTILRCGENDAKAALQFAQDGGIGFESFGPPINPQG